MQLLPVIFTNTSSEPRYALSFLSGVNEGKKLSLRKEHEILIGRNKGLDFFLDDTLVSRQHAKITVSNGHIQIKDLDSKNGVYVNGERVAKARLKEGDRIRIGSSMIQIVTVPDELAVPARNNGSSAGPAASTTTLSGHRGLELPGVMSGPIEAVSLVDLLQLLTTVGKSCVVVVRFSHGTGKIHLRNGQVCYAAIEEKPDFDPHKAIFRLLALSSGTFEVEPAEDVCFERELSESTTSLLMHASQYLDEMRQLRPQLPPFASSVLVPSPPPASPGELTPDELAVYQLARKHGTLQSVMDHSPGPDLDTCRHFAALLQREFLVVP